MIMVHLKMWTRRSERYLMAQLKWPKLMKNFNSFSQFDTLTGFNPIPLEIILTLGQISNRTHINAALIIEAMDQDLSYYPKKVLKNQLKKTL